ncbi:MAG: hypothetical protein P8Z69_07120 [Acidihalobacter sp.]
MPVGQPVRSQAVSWARNSVTGCVGVLITVRLESGRLVAVTHKAGQGLRVGQKVQVLYGRNGETRVFPF